MPKDRNAELEKHFHYCSEKGHATAPSEKGGQGAREKRDLHIMARSRVDNGGVRERRP